MSNAKFRVPVAHNEPVWGYAPDSPEREALKAELRRQSDEEVEIPLIIDGEEIRTGNTEDVVAPHNHDQVLGKVHLGDASHVEAAAAACKRAEREWAETPWQDRAAIFLKAAELLAGPWRQVLNASTMLGQSKNAYQAEIDAACELIDFWRFNVQYMQEIYEDQPLSGPGCWNRVEQRGLEGFILAVCPFNFTSIAGNLPTSPALMGTTAIFKPATTAALSNYYIMKLLQEAGLPKGVVNFVPGHGADIGDPAFAHEDFAGVHFTGSTATFQRMWQSMGANIRNYKTYPRIVGETGGKDFVFAHPSAHVEALVTALVRGAYEYQGQKCSAASRAYIPQSLWPQVKDMLLTQVSKLKMGSPLSFDNFVNAVIDKPAFASIKGYIDHARECPDSEILCGGTCDDKRGYFIEPTVIEAKRPDTKTMVEEIFGPVLTVYVYADSKIDDALQACDTASAYALTGAIFSQDRYAAVRMADALRQAAGNFYINDKPTGAVVGQQPFGGSRASGTNDKAGSKLNLTRWCSTRTLKETFVPPTDYRYPFLAE